MGDWGRNKEHLVSMGVLRRLYYNLLMFPGIHAIRGIALRNCATVFMLHRFRHPARGIDGFEPSELRQGLEYLRRKNYELVPLTVIFDRLVKGEPPLHGAVAFTIDDGYVDQAEIASVVFAEFDCHVTTFLATGFVDGHLWFWWDKIEFILAHTKRRSLRVSLGDRWLEYRWESLQERQGVQANLTEQCKLVGDSDKHRAIAALASEADVSLPDVPPGQYAPMSWEQARGCERRGMTFGPHTVTHPILSRTSDSQSAEEIRASWRRVSDEVRSPVPIFCYPNGGWRDFGSRETKTLGEAGLLGAVVGEPGYADQTVLSLEEAGPYKVRRFGFPETVPRIVQYVSGVERVKQRLRGEL